MSEPARIFELPKHVERFLASLSKLYAQEGNRQLQEIIVNANARVHEEWSFDNWNGGTYGHAIYLSIPEALYLSAIQKREEIQERIATDFNKIHNVQNEFVEKVFIEMELREDQDWRNSSGLLIGTNRVIPPEATKRIWDDDCFRVFLSHKTEIKVAAASLKHKLQKFGVSCFVAHEDIHPTKTWQDEIENALGSMDAFVALLSEGFHESNWTDQEVGFAVARGVPIIAVRMGRDPYGFIGKFQAVRGDEKTLDDDILKLLIKNDRMFTAYIAASRKCSSWVEGNVLSTLLPHIERATPTQLDDLVQAYNESIELRGSYGFNGSKTWIYGKGLVFHLNRLGSRRFVKAESGLIEIE